MKNFIALGLGCLLTQGLMAQETVPTIPAAPGKALPVLPADCNDQIESTTLYCSTNVIDGNQVTVTFAAVVSKEVFPTVESVLARYTDVARWPEYAAASPQTVIEFAKTDGSVPALTVGTTLNHVYDYSLKVQGIPFLKQAVKGMTVNEVVAPYEGALASLEFAAQTTPYTYEAVVAGKPVSKTVQPKGVKSQVGSVHAVACDVATLAVCDETKWLLIYETTIQPDIPFAFTIAANTVTAGIEDLLVGMLDESIVTAE